MHVVPELLYRLTTRDIGGVWARLLYRRASSASVSATVAAELVTEADRVLVLTNLAGFINPGAAQFPTEAFFGIITPDQTATFALRAEMFPGMVANQQARLNWEGEVLVPPGWRVRLFATFNAGAAANTAVVDVVGCSIPLGTIQLP